MYVKCHSKEESCDVRESLHGTWFNGIAIHDGLVGIYKWKHFVQVN